MILELYTNLISMFSLYANVRIHTEFLNIQVVAAPDTHHSHHAHMGIRLLQYLHLHVNPNTVRTLN